MPSSLKNTFKPHTLQRTSPSSKSSTRRFTISPLKRQTQSPHPQTPPPNPAPLSPRARLINYSSRLPPFLQSYTTPLLHAPTTHISSFLLLHELTAVVPLFGFAGLFYYSGWSPEWVGEWKGVDEGVARFTRYFRRKGWIGDESAVQGREGVVTVEGGGKVKVDGGGGKEGARVVLAFATAYALTKALLPLRLILSVWATPWCARIFVTPIANLARRMVPARGKAAAATTAKSK